MFTRLKYIENSKTIFYLNLFPIVLMYGVIMLLSCTLSRSQETTVPNELPIVQEITCVLREWSSIWKDLYMVSHLYVYKYKQVHTHTNRE